jgi:AcrR family transcriptional regulator
MIDPVHTTHVPVDGVRQAPRELPPTAEKILEGARRVLLKKGHRGLTMQAIGREAKVNRSLVHYYFGSKEGLMEALVGRTFEDPKFSYRDTVVGAPDGEARAHALFDWLERITVDDRAARMLFELLPHILRTKKLRSRATELYEAYRRFDGQCLAGEQADLALIEDLGALSVAVVDGLSVQTAVAGHAFPTDRAFSLWRDMVFTYLRSREAQFAPAEGR